MIDRLVLDRAGLRQCGIHLCNSTLLRLEANGKFVRRIRIGGSVYWSRIEVEAYLNLLGAEREVSR